MSARLADRRIRLLAVLFALVFAGALGRAAWLQAVQAPSLGRLATNQQRETITLPARRGTVYDRLGVELAIGEEATAVYANPTQIRDLEGTAVAVAEELGLDAQTVSEQLSDRSSSFVYLVRKADPQAAARLEERELAGIGFHPEERRVYPQNRIGAALIGYAGVDNEGLAGLELEYDDVLGGEAGEETIVRDPFGRLLDVLDTRPVRDGRDISLTIDHRLQAHVEQVLRETREAWGAKAATAVVIDPRTGAVLAIATEPGFDANRFPDAPLRARARAITDTYEPGSTFKVVTVAAALEEGIVTPATSFDLPPSIEIADRVIHEAKKREWETMTVSQILSRSSNVGAVTLALQVGKERLSRWIERFGFGEQTGIDFPGESAGITLAPDEWTGSTIGNVPLGQGIAVTPLQMAAAYAAIANGGVWTQPHLVTRVGGERVDPPEQRRVISVETSAKLTRMMRTAVDEGTGAAARVAGYTVAGKTGTAAKPEPTGGYSDSRYVASFVGFVPARFPRLTILVAIDEPEESIWGGDVAAPAFSRIAEFALPYLEVPPDAPLEPAP